MRAAVGQSAFQPVASAGATTHSLAITTASGSGSAGRNDYKESAFVPKQPSCSYGFSPWHTWDARNLPTSGVTGLPHTHATIPRRVHQQPPQSCYPRAYREYCDTVAGHEFLLTRSYDDQHTLQRMLRLAEGKALLSPLDEREEIRAALAVDRYATHRALSGYLSSLPASGSALPTLNGMGSKRRTPSPTRSPQANKSRRCFSRSPFPVTHVRRPSSLDQSMGPTSESQLLPLFKKRFNGVDSWTKVYIPRRVAEKNFPIVSAGQECQLEAVDFDGRLSTVTFRRDQRGDFALKHAGGILRGSGMSEGDEVVFCMDVHGRLVLIMQKAGKAQSESSSRVKRVRSDLSILFHKKLSSAEVKQHKLYLPKKEAIQHLPNLMACESCAMSLADVFDNEYSLQLQCRALTIKGETYRQFVLKGMAGLMSKYALQPGDTVFFAVDRNDGALVLCGPNDDTTGRVAP